MRTQRLGCINPVGVAAALVTLVIVISFSVAQGGILFSPGGLSGKTGPTLGGVNSHSQISGNCSACHTAPWDQAGMSSRCLDCHVNIQEELTSTASMHSILFDGKNMVDCRECHTEHHGSSGVLTNLDVHSFPHEMTGFSLNSHQHKSIDEEFECKDCHTGGLTKFSITVCDECHRQLDSAFQVEHNQVFGVNCLGCHDGVDTYGSEFSHNSTSFPLEGEHQPLECSSCHTGSTTASDLKNTPANCIGCHQKDDPHSGQMGQDCASCHSPSGWIPAKFDHSKFQLLGKHQLAACSACHVDGKYEGTPTSCIGCHNSDDVHNGQMGEDCSECHTSSGWLPANFDHSKYSFQLVGEHQTVPCMNCHIDGKFKGTPSTCAACHSSDDVHRGQMGDDCAACHSPAGWLPASFDHSTTAFPLNGKHQNTACSSCHIDHQYKGSPTSCGACHSGDDIHNGQMGTDCAACHTTNGWLPATFDHSKTRFQLVGSHQNVTCSACHANRVYKGTPTVCGSCHSDDDPHGGQFGSDCSLCHTPQAWNVILFDHNTTQFPLTGSHSSQPCTKCHQNGRFRGTPTACSACHSDPVFHQGLFGSNCADCHSTNAWRPASFNGAHSFPLEHGGAESCRDCHPSSFTSWTCYTCHNQGEVASKHSEEGIGDFSNCLECHADGTKGEDHGGGGGEDDD